MSSTFLAVVGIAAVVVGFARVVIAGLELRLKYIERWEKRNNRTYKS